LRPGNAASACAARLRNATTAASAMDHGLITDSNDRVRLRFRLTNRVMFERLLVMAGSVEPCPEHAPVSFQARPPDDVTLRSGRRSIAMRDWSDWRLALPPDRHRWILASVHGPRLQMKANPPSRWYCSQCGQRVDIVRATRRCLDCEVTLILEDEWDRELLGWLPAWPDTPGAEIDRPPQRVISPGDHPERIL
jgi:hypothetical protein